MEEEYGDIPEAGFRRAPWLKDRAARQLELDDDHRAPHEDECEFVDALPPHTPLEPDVNAFKEQQEYAQAPATDALWCLHDEYEPLPWPEFQHHAELPPSPPVSYRPLLSPEVQLHDQSPPSSPTSYRPPPSPDVQHQYQSPSSSPTSYRPRSASPPPSPSPSPSPRSTAEVHCWSSRHVGHWLQSLGLGAYRAAFNAQAVDGIVLLTITDEQLKSDLAVNVLGHRMRIRAAIEELRLAARGNAAEPEPAPVQIAQEMPARRRSPSPNREQQLRMMRIEYEAERARLRAERLAMRAQEAANAAIAASTAAAIHAASLRAVQRAASPRVVARQDAATSPRRSENAAFIAERTAMAQRAHQARLAAAAAQRARTKWAPVSSDKDVYAAARADAFLAGIMASVLGERDPRAVDVSAPAVVQFLAAHGDALGVSTSQTAAACGDDAEATKSWLLAILRRRDFDARLSADEARRRERLQSQTAARTPQRRHGTAVGSFDAFLQRQWAALPPDNTLSLRRNPTASLPSPRKGKDSVPRAEAPPRSRRLRPLLLLAPEPPRPRPSEVAMLQEFDGNVDAVALAADMRARVSRLQEETRAMRTRMSV